MPRNTRLVVLAGLNLATERYKRSVAVQSLGNVAVEMVAININHTQHTQHSNDLLTTRQVKTMLTMRLEKDYFNL